MQHGGKARHGWDCFASWLPVLLPPLSPPLLPLVVVSPACLAHPRLLPTGGPDQRKGGCRCEGPVLNRAARPGRHLLLHEGEQWVDQVEGTAPLAEWCPAWGQNALQPVAQPTASRCSLQAQCVLRPCCARCPMPCSVPCQRAHSLAAALQTFLLPFDPEDHEDADEWREYSGELSSKELHKVGCVERDGAGIGVLVAQCTCCWALQPLCANASSVPPAAAHAAKLPGCRLQLSCSRLRAFPR